MENELCSFSNPSVASPTSQFTLQPFFHFSYVTSSSLNSPELCSLSNLSFTSPTSQLILQSFHCFTYVTVHSPTLLLLLLRHKLQALHLIHLASHPRYTHFHHFTYVTALSPALLSLLLHHRLFTYVTW